MLKIGDIIVCKVNCSGITYGREYNIIQKRDYKTKDICITDDNNNNWWFGQIGQTEEWTRWFMMRSSLIN
jgi:hypothetical protein